jgi:hypothetical protein
MNKNEQNRYDQCTRVECAPNPFSAKVSAMSPV